MGRREESITTLQVTVTDDYDGKPLPEETQPVTLTYGNKTYELYLSDANAKRLDDTIEKYTKNATPVSRSNSRSSRRSSRSSQPGRDYGAIRAWAKANGHKVAEKGRVSASIIEAYEAAR